jgi:uncharacterized membrane protein
VEGIVNTDYQQSGTARAEAMALGLGWFSIALGAAEVLAPHSVARLIGIAESETNSSVLRAMGVREIGNGIAILSQPDRASWLWTRVGGDALDLSLLGSAFGQDYADRGRLGAATAAVLGVTALDVIAARRLGGGDGRPSAARAHEGVRVERVETINRPIEEVYRFWRNFANFPRFMRHLESVQVIDERRSRWRAKAPAGMSVEWDAELVQERENEWMAWRSLEGSQIENSGSVRFQRAPGARGTEVRVQLQYHPPAGAVGRGVAWLFGEEPAQQIKDDLRRFKQLMETGEIPLSEGPGLWRAARPPRSADEIKTIAGVRS